MCPLAAIVAWATLLVAAGQCVAATAAAATATPPPARVLHVCDCPPGQAAEERGELLRAFAKRGYVPGRNLLLTTGSTGSLRDAPPAATPPDALPLPFGPSPYGALLREEAARLRPQLILASGVRVVTAARDTALPAPVVFWRITDPVGLGVAATLARPGGNLTGFSRGIEKLTVKRLELLHEMVPKAQRVGFVSVADFPAHARQAAEVAAAAPRIGVAMRAYALPLARWNEAELDALFATMRRDGVDALLLPDLNVTPTVLVALAARHRLPTVHSLTHVVTDWGGLAAYATVATDPDDVVGYAVRILGGERAADLPVQEPTRFELVLNARAARGLGLTFPPSFLLRADQVVDK